MLFVVFANTPPGTRTPNPLIKSQLPENHKNGDTKEIEEAKLAAAAPATALSAKTPPDLAEIISAWPQLPEHIKRAIVTLVTAAREQQNR